MINDFVVSLLVAQQGEQGPISLTRSVGSGPSNQVSHCRFWENRPTPNSLPTKGYALITNQLSKKFKANSDLNPITPITKF